jgi:hypothetical protein
MDVNYLFKIVAKLSKSERSFIKELRTSKIPRILRLMPPVTEEVKYFDFYSMVYMFEFADIVKLNMRRPNDYQGELNYWVDFFLKGLPLSYHCRRL